MQLPVRNSGFINSLIAISENVSAANDRVEGRIRREGKVEKGKEVGGKTLIDFCLIHIRSLSIFKVFASENKRNVALIDKTQKTVNRRLKRDKRRSTAPFGRSPV